MKELEIKVQDTVEVKAEVPVEFKYLGSKRRIPGLKLWECDLRTFKVKEAPTNKEVVMGMDGKKKEKFSVIHNHHAIYHQSHCKRTAIRKFRVIIEAMGGIILDD
jgi:hypothetical protein